MFLLTDEMICEYDKHHLLGIQPLDRNFLHPTYYYFRLGAMVKVWNEQLKKFVPEDISEPGNNVLTLQPHAYVLVVSYERFDCTKRVRAELGQITRLPMKGLELLHGPTVDPGFSGQLQMAITNHLSIQRELGYAEPIGKISFYDVSDTYPIGDIKGTVSEDTYARRGKATEPEPAE